MYPDLLGAFGVELYGVRFEQVVWGLLALLMAWGVVSSVRLWRKGRKGEGLVQGILTTGILAWSVAKEISAFGTDYALFFSEPLVLHTYAFCLLIGVGLGIWTASYQAKFRGFAPGEIVRLCLVLVFLGILGARAAHVIVDAPMYWNSCFAPHAAGLAEPDCLRVFKLGEGGLTFYGGVIAGLLVIAVFLIRRRRQGHRGETLPLMDILASALAIAHACGRMGCLAAGCCWGAVTTGNIGVRYETGSFAFAELVKNPEYQAQMVKDGMTPRLHATQIYESIGELAIYGACWAILLRHGKPGKMAGMWLLGYGILRFVLEIMRDDEERGHFFELAIEPVNRWLNLLPEHTTLLSTSQGIALVMMAMGGLTLIAAHLAPSSKS